MIPTECKMPLLFPELERLLPRLLLTSFIGGVALSTKAASIRRNVVRLVDKAVSEYSFARQYLLDQIAESQRNEKELLQGRIIFMFGFVDHMENCLNATRRILELLQWLRADATAPMQDRIQRRLVEAHVEPLIEIRDLLEHMGEAINGNRIGDHEPVVLVLGDDEETVRIGKYSLSFSSLATILRAFHCEAVRLLEPPQSSGAA
jgi:hypothetical protein